MQPSTDGVAAAVDLASILSKTQPELIAWFRRRLPQHRRDEAQDLAQETLLAAWTVIRAGSQDVRHMARYLRSIARNKLCDSLRRNRRRSAVSIDDAESDALPFLIPPGSIDGLLLEAERRARIARALLCLDQMERKLLTLRYFNGLQNAEACRMLGIRPEEGSRLKYRALEKLRLQFGGG